MRTSAPTARESALKFTEGVRSGWLASDLVAWTEEHLLRPERLRISSPEGVWTVCEHGLGVVPLRAEPQGSERSEVVLIPQLLEVSRQQILQALRATVQTGQATFAHAALVASRVVRDPSSERLRWRVDLPEQTALSDRVLALFAVDALENPADYENDLSVCDVCGAVSLNSARSGTRYGCAAHPFGALESQRGRSPTPAAGIAVRRRCMSP